jgi:hypothetical protein
VTASRSSRSRPQHERSMMALGLSSPMRHRMPAAFLRVPRVRPRGHGEQGHCCRAVRPRAGRRHAQHDGRHDRDVGGAAALRAPRSEHVEKRVARWAQYHGGECRPIAHSRLSGIPGHRLDATAPGRARSPPSRPVVLQRSGPNRSRIPQSDRVASTPSRRIHGRPIPPAKRGPPATTLEANSHTPGVKAVAERPMSRSDSTRSGAVALSPPG